MVKWKVWYFAEMKRKRCDLPNCLTAQAYSDPLVSSLSYADRLPQTHRLYISQARFFYHKLEILQWGRAPKWWARWLVGFVPHLLSKLRLRRAKRVGWGIEEEEDDLQPNRDGSFLRSADEVNYSATDSDSNSEDDWNDDYDPKVCWGGVGGRICLRIARKSVCSPS